MKHHNVRNRLIDSTVEVIASKGLDKTTTKAIVGDTSINEVYIYTCFKNKEDLLAKTFDSLDEEILGVAMMHVDVIYLSGIDNESRWRLYFSPFWNFLIGNKSKCLAYVRYYYSPYFTKNSYKSHIQRCLPLIESFKNAFQENTDTEMILSYMLNAALDFAVKIHNGQMPHGISCSEYVFRIIYRSVEQFFKKDGQ